MFGTHHCCNSSSSCIFDTRERAPALAGAERQNIVYERVVRILPSASNVLRSVTSWRILPTIVSTLPHLRGDMTGSFQASEFGCRQGDDKAN